MCHPGVTWTLHLSPALLVAAHDPVKRFIVTCSLCLGIINPPASRRSSASPIHSSAAPVPHGIGFLHWKKHCCPYVDSFSKLVHFVSLQKPCLAAETWDLLLHHNLHLHVISRDSALIGGWWRSFCTALEASKKFSSGYQTEWVNQTRENALCYIAAWPLNHLEHHPSGIHPILPGILCDWSFMAATGFQWIAGRGGSSCPVRPSGSICTIGGGSSVYLPLFCTNPSIHLKGLFREFVCSFLLCLFELLFACVPVQLAYRHLPVWIMFRLLASWGQLWVLSSSLYLPCKRFLLIYFLPVSILC